MPIELHIDPTLRPEEKLYECRMSSAAPLGLVDRLVVNAVLETTVDQVCDLLY